MPVESHSTRRLFCHIVSGSKLSEMDIQERKFIIEPFITEASITLVHGPRGGGKTFFIQEMEACVANGTPFFGFQVPSPRTVLHIDGEMPTVSLKQRYQFIFAKRSPENLQILPSDSLWPEGRLNLHEEDSQRAVQTLLDEMKAHGINPAVIVFDNLSSLTSGLDESSNSMQDSLLSWLIGLRHQGYALVLIHHSGKNGDQRGASRREDPVDTVIRLLCRTSVEQKGATFEIAFTKHRNVAERPGSISVQLAEGHGGDAVWNVLKGARGSSPKYLEALKFIADETPEGPSELGDLLGVQRQAAERHLATLRKKGLIEEGRPFRITAAGEKALGRHAEEP